MTSNAGIDALLPQNDPDYVYWQETEKIFGASEQVVIGITAKDSVYTVKHLKLVYMLSMAAQFRAPLRKGAYHESRRDKAI